MYLDALDEYRGSTLGLLRQAAGLIALGYRIQAVSSFNWYTFIAQLSLTIFCFGASSLPIPLILTLISILGALLLRDALTYKAPRSEAQYYIDLAGDAAVAGVFLLAAEAMTLTVAPLAALPSPVLYRGALVCLPMIPILRMALRPRPDPEMPSQGSGVPAETRYKRTWRLNLLWAGTVNALVFMTLSNRPNSIADFLQMSSTVIWFGLLATLKRNALGRMKFQTLFTNRTKQDKEHKKNLLPKVVEKSDPLYGWYVAIGAILYFKLAQAMVMILWPWLSGDPDATFLRPAVAMVAFAVAVLTWRYVKLSNIAAARALQAEIDGPAPG
jgi:hypothetical protein